VSEKIAQPGNAENECWGVEHVYRYENSPVVVEEAGTPPSFEPTAYRPSTWPESHLPAVFLPGGSSVHDLIGTGLTLLALAECNTSGWARLRLSPRCLRRSCFSRTRTPHAYSTVPSSSRPDHHIAWRGDDQEATDPRQVLGMAVGHATVSLNQ
jgi:hypothetical protein